MVTASSALLALLASGTPCWQADLYVFTLTDGTVIRCTSFDRPITYGGNVYPALGPYIRRSAVKLAVGLTASKIDIEFLADANSLVESQAILLTIAQGKWTGAGCTVRRAFMPTPGDTDCGGAGDGTIVRFAGEVGAVAEVGPLNAKFEDRDQLYRMNRKIPKNLYQPGCWHQLFDAGCTLSESGSYGGNPFSSSGAVAAGSTASTILTGLTSAGVVGPPTAAPSLSGSSNPVPLPAATYYAVVTYVTAHGETIQSPEASIAVSIGRTITVASPAALSGATGWNVYVATGSGDEEKQNSAPIAIGSNWTMPSDGLYLSGIIPPQFPSNGYWAQGVIKFTSGALSGLSAYVIASDPSGALALSVPLPAAPAAGDGWTLVTGCDKTRSTCEHKFGNLIHFTGVPFTPTPEAGV